VLEKRGLMHMNRTDNELLKLVKASNERMEIMSFFSSHEQTEYFSVGIASEVFEKEIIIDSFQSSRFHDGFITRRISDIYRIETNTRYNRKIRVLSEISGARHEKMRRVDENGFTTLLTFALENRKVVSIELHDSDRTDAAGFVMKITGDECSILLLDPYGEAEGESLFKIADISHMTCDGESEIAILQMHDWKANHGPEMP
jgi:hypothetical protein